MSEQTMSTEERAVEMWNNGDSIDDITRILDINKTYLKKILRKNGLDTTDSCETAGQNWKDEFSKSWNKARFGVIGKRKK